MDSQAIKNFTKLPRRVEEAALTLREVVGLVLPKPDSKGAVQQIRGRRVEEHRLTGALWEAAELSSPVQPRGQRAWNRTRQRP